MLRVPHVVFVDCVQWIDQKNAELVRKALVNREMCVTQLEEPPADADRRRVLSDASEVLQEAIDQAHEEFKASPSMHAA